jgi:hypothetical protein
MSGDAAFAHDTLMPPDAGPVRSDGSIQALGDSIRAILALPLEARILVSHDCGGMDLEMRSTPPMEVSITLSATPSRPDCAIVRHRGPTTGTRWP